MQQSAWWIIYRIENWQPKFLLLKRQSLSKVIEWVAPKWKIEAGETPAQAAIREIWEEVGIDSEHLENKGKLWDLYIKLQSADKWNFEKKKTEIYQRSSLCRKMVWVRIEQSRCNYYFEKSISSGRKRSKI